MEPLPTHPKQAEIKVYSKDYCPYCVAAKNFLTQKGVSYNEIDITRDDAQRQEMLKKSEGRSTVPQIFIGGKAIGGFTDMKALDEQGQLEALLFPKGR